MERVLLHALTPALESTYHLRSSLHTSHSRTKLWMLTLIRPNIVEEDYHHLIWMPLQGFRWFLCCRQGFSLLGRDYGEREEEESFELRNNENLTSNGRVNWPHFAFDSNYIFTYCTFKRFVYYMPFFVDSVITEWTIFQMIQCLGQIAKQDIQYLNYYSLSYSVVWIPSITLFLSIPMRDLKHMLALVLQYRL